MTTTVLTVRLAPEPLGSLTRHRTVFDLAKEFFDGCETDDPFDPSEWSADGCLMRFVSQTPGRCWTTVVVEVLWDCEWWDHPLTDWAWPVWATPVGAVTRERAA